MCEYRDGAKMRGILSLLLTCVTFPLFGCASTQLNYNTLDLASTVDSLVTSQVLTNLAKFVESPTAIPSQVAITSGTVTTNNTINPSISDPINAGSTATTTLATSTSNTLTKTFTGNRTNAGLSLAGTDQWTQTWGVSPLTDPDQLRRLRVLYQFGAGYLTREELLCNYPLIQKKDNSSQTGSTAPVSVTYPTTDGKTATVQVGAPPAEKKDKTIYKLICKGHELEFEPDPAFLNPPSCVICADPSRAYSTNMDECDKKYPRDANSHVVCLHLNHRLQNGWLKVAEAPFGAPAGAISLGLYRGKTLYVTSVDDLEQFYEFSLFVLEATTQSATSATGQSAGKGTATKTAPLLLAPAPMLE